MQKIIDKQQIYSCYKYLTTVKHTFIFNKVPENLFAYLRISGIWESNNQIGITSKMHIYPSTEKFWRIVFCIPTIIKLINNIKYKIVLISESNVSLKIGVLIWVA